MPAQNNKIYVALNLLLCYNRINQPMNTKIIILLLGAATISYAETNFMKQNWPGLYEHEQKVLAEQKKVAAPQQNIIGEINKTSWTNIFGQQINGQITFVDSSIVGIRVGLAEYLYDRAKLCEQDQEIINRFYKTFLENKLMRFQTLSLPIGEYQGAETYFAGVKQLVAAQRYSEVDGCIQKYLSENKKACADNDTLNRDKPLLRSSIGKKLFNDERILRGFIIDRLRELNSTRATVN